MDSHSKRIALVTGGSRGVGAATCRYLAEEGYDIAFTFQSDAVAAENVARGVKAAGRRCFYAPADISDHNEVEQLFNAIENKLGPITHLVNNAGVIGRSGHLWDADPEMLQRCVNVNVVGTMLVTRRAIPHMSVRHGGNGGAIVNISSAAATVGSPGEFVWNAVTKGAVDTLTLGLSKELAIDRIRVNSVAPGLIDTDIHASAGDAERINRLKSNIPWGRAGTPREVASTIAFLLSDASSYVTGAILRVAGGR